jgi:glutamyl/glutaminyl-tRNA synthetase
MRTRIAPTPSGYLHLGNLFNFMLTWIRARQQGMHVLLRIDDADSQRKRSEYLEDIFKTLDWLGIDWNLGPTGIDDFEKNWSQRHRKSNYNALLDELLQTNQVFSCSCSRSTIDAIKSCTCKENPSPNDVPVAIKINTPLESFRFLDDKIGTVDCLLTPFVVCQKNGEASYQVSSLADDRFFQITHVFRGEDLIDSTARQLYVDNMLGGSEFQHIHFHHHKLVIGNNGKKLSKSAGAQRQSIRNQYTRTEIFHAFAEWQQVNGKIPETMNLWLSVRLD